MTKDPMGYGDASQRDILATMMVLLSNLGFWFVRSQMGSVGTENGYRARGTIFSDKAIIAQRQFSDSS